MSRVRTSYWSEFADWLMMRGIAPTTATNYLSLVRRVQRDCSDPADQGTLTAYVDALLPQTVRNPLKAAWTQYAAWNAEQGKPLPVYAGGPSIAIPAGVGAQIKQIVAAGVKLHHVPKLRWLFNRDPGIAALARGDQVWLAAPLEAGLDWALCPLDAGLIDEIKATMYPDRQPTEVDPLVPAAPNSTAPMTATQLRAATK